MIVANLFRQLTLKGSHICRKKTNPTNPDLEEVAHDNVMHCQIIILSARTHLK